MSDEEAESTEHKSKEAPAINIETLPDALARSKQAPVALREDQVANAVAFLTNPKVVGANSSEKRTFLRGKGVSDEEIDEAFRRAVAIVPQHSPTQELQPAQLPEAQPLVQQVTKTAGPAQNVALQPQASWAQQTASAALVALAAYGVGTLLSPIATRCWRYFRGSEEPTDMHTQFTELVQQLAKKQDEQIAKVTIQAASAVQQIKIPLEMQEEASRAQAAQQVSSDFKGHLDALKKEVSRLSTTVVGNATFSQELTELKSMIQQQQAVLSERSTPEVMSRWQPLQESSPSMYTAAASFPEPNLSAADRAAAAACSTSLGSTSSFKKPAQPLAPKLPLGGPGGGGWERPGRYGGAESVPASFGWGNGSSNGAGGGVDEAPSFARPAADSPLQNGGQHLGVSCGISETSQASVYSEPDKPSDYVEIMAMLERVRRGL